MVPRSCPGYQTHILLSCYIIAIRFYLIFHGSQVPHTQDGRVMSCPFVEVFKTSQQSGKNVNGKWINL